MREGRDRRRSWVGRRGGVLVQSRLQLSLWRHQRTEDFIVICNYVGFLWGLSLVRSHTEALFSQGILSSRGRVTEGGWGRGLSRLFMLNSEGADMAARSGRGVRLKLCLQAGYNGSFECTPKLLDAFSQNLAVCSGMCLGVDAKKDERIRGETHIRASENGCKTRNGRRDAGGGGLQRR